MKFGFSKYIELSDGKQYPLPNGYSESYISEKITDNEYHTLSQFNPYKFLFKKDIEYCDHGFIAASVDSLIEQSEVFIYPILIKSLFDIENLNNEKFFLIDTKIVNLVKTNRCKIVLFYLLEGDFAERNHFDGVNNFVLKYGFSKRDVALVNNNLILEERAEQNGYHQNFSILTYNYFLTNPWFIANDFLDQANDLKFKQDLDNKLKYVCEFTKGKTFLILNRRPRPHRIVLFTEIMKDELLKNNSIISMGGINIDSKEQKSAKEDWVKTYTTLLDGSYKHNIKSGIEFLEKHDNTKNHFADANLNYNLAFNINETLQLNTFVSVITETLFGNSTIFLSEKIFKPIFSCQPFIVLGNPFILRELRKLGFETFGDFWDESYDEETNFTKRVEKIIDLLHTINSKSNDELLTLTNNMYSVLRKNYENLITRSRDEVFKLKRLLNEQFS